MIHVPHRMITGLGVKVKELGSNILEQDTLSTQQISSSLPL